MNKKIYDACRAKARRRRGFTLIELLVVVLIIGILAAIAVPQYNKTVMRSRAAEAVTNIKAIANAQKAYMLATGSPTFNFQDLDVTMDNNCAGVGCKAGKWYYHLNGDYFGVGAYYNVSAVDTTTLTILYRFQANAKYPNFDVDAFACLPRGKSEWIAACKSIAASNVKTEDTFDGGTGYVWK
jgi:prepilin-type N-terminal cleavage/methylation domain-containing protein